MEEGMNLGELERGILWTELCPLKILMLKLLTSSVIDKPFKEVIKVQWDHKDDPLI